MKIIESTELDFSDVLIVPQRINIASRKDVNIKREYIFKYCPYIIEGTGIMQANMGTVGTFEVSKKMLKAGMFACLHKHYDLESLVKFYQSLDKEERMRCFLSIGLMDNGYDKFKFLYNEGLCTSVCIDVPNGYISSVMELVKKIRLNMSNCLLMVGNVVTSNMTKDLIYHGADIVKVGLGNGSNCITRKQTGVGRPQLSAIIDCGDAAHEIGGMICGDGGIACPGDIGKAFGGGADFIMIGGLYAGTDEADGEIIEKTYKTNETAEEEINEYVAHVPIYEKKKYKLFYGMSSTYAQEKFGDGKRNYRASEGRVTLVPYVGSVDDVNEELLGGLRSTMTYIGAKNLDEIHIKCNFYKTTSQLNRIYENTTIGK